MFGILDMVAIWLIVAALILTALLLTALWGWLSGIFTRRVNDDGLLLLCGQCLEVVARCECGNGHDIVDEAGFCWPSPPVDLNDDGDDLLDRGDAVAFCLGYEGDPRKCGCEGCEAWAAALCFNCPDEDGEWRFVHECVCGEGDKGDGLYYPTDEDWDSGEIDPVWEDYDNVLAFTVDVDTDMNWDNGSHGDCDGERDEERYGPVEPGEWGFDHAHLTYALSAAKRDSQGQAAERVEFMEIPF